MEATIFGQRSRGFKACLEELENNFQELMSNIYSVEVVKERKNKFRQTLKNKIISTSI
jgi:hypothetical protein